MRRVMREVGVHLEHEIVAVLEPPAESSDICGAESHLARPLDDMQPRLMLHDIVDHVASAIRRTVVDDEDIEAIILFDDGTDKTRDVLALIVCRDNDEGPFSH